jgi:hypothetical protein
MASPAVGGRESHVAGDPRQPWARWSGWLFLGVALSLLVVHGGAQIVSGQRVTGTDDVDAIRAFYDRAGLLPLFWQHGLGIILFAGAVVTFRRYLMGAATSPVDRAFVDIGTLIAAAVVPLALTELGLQMAMVQVSGSSGGDGLFGVFAAWDWIYNSAFYWLEVGWVFCFNFVALRTRSLPRAVAVIGLVVAAAHVFHSAVLMLGLSDLLTFPATALFMVWFIATGVSLVRRGERSAPPA